MNAARVSSTLVLAAGLLPVLLLRASDEDPDERPGEAERARRGLLPGSAAAFNALSAGREDAL